MFARPDNVIEPVAVEQLEGPDEEESVIAGVGFTTTLVVAVADEQARAGDV